VGNPTVTEPLFVTANTITAVDDRVLLFSCDQFVADICHGDCCFICGATPGSKTFNDEHVIPKWVLRRFGLFNQQVTLPNGDRRYYRGYTMPCCQDCNDLLGQRVETPISHLLEGNFEDIVERIDGETVHLLFVWLSLIFLKTHMKDRAVRVHRDPRVGTEKIADGYFWPDLHHLHCVARAPYVEAQIEPAVVGSVRIFKVEDPTSDGGFDYADMTEEQTVVLRLGDFGVAAVLNDSGAAAIAIDHHLAKIDRSITMVQLREVAARLGVANSDLVNRPEFGSLVHTTPPERVRLWARHDPEPVFSPLDPEKLGSALAHILADRMGSFDIEGERDPAKLDAMFRTGRVSFLFDGDGAFTPAKITFEKTDQAGA
jgi:hypothetical protein